MAPQQHPHNFHHHHHHSHKQQASLLLSLLTAVAAAAGGGGCCRANGARPALLMAAVAAVAGALLAVQPAAAWRDVQLGLGRGVYNPSLVVYEVRHCWGVPGGGGSVEGEGL